MAATINYNQPYFTATNGDLIKFYSTSTAGNPIASYSTNNGTTWTSLGTPLSAAFSIRFVCASTTTNDVFYVIATTSSLNKGIVATYNTATRTMTWSGGSTTIGGVPQDTTSTNVDYYFNYRMHHDGTNVYVLRSGFTETATTYGDYNFSATNTVYSYTASTFGTTTGTTTSLDGAKSYSRTYSAFSQKNVFIGSASSGRLLIVIPDWSPTYTVYIQEFTVSGTTVTKFGSSTLSPLLSSEKPVYVQNPTTKTLYALGASRTWTYTTTLSGPIASSLATPVVAFPAKGPGALRLIAGENPDSKTWNMSESVDGLTWFKTSTFTTGIPTYGTTYAAGTFYAPAQSYGSTPSGLVPRIYLRTYYTTTINYVGYSYDKVQNLYFNVVPKAIPTSPINGTQTFDQTADTIPLVWTYSDSDGTTQTAYSVLVAENTAGATSYYLTSGGALNASEQTIVSSATTISIPPGTLSASNYGYTWSVRARDEDNEFGSWSASNLFRTAGRPTISVITPTANSAYPNTGFSVSYSYADPESNALHASRVVLYDAAGTSLWDDTEYVGGTVASGETYTHPVTYELTAGGYSVGIYALDATGIWSSETRVQFVVTEPTATAPTWSTSVDADGIVTVTVTDPNGSLFTSATLYRWSARLNKYVLVASPDTTSFTITDRYAPMIGSFTYRLVLSGTLGLKSYISPTVTTAVNGWRIATPTAMVAVYPNDFSLNSVIAEELLEPIGRTRQVRSYLGLHGYEGSLSIEVLASERDEVAASLEALVTADAWIRTPFGASYRVALATPQVSYGAGGRATITLNFTEVGDA